MMVMLVFMRVRVLFVGMLLVVIFVLMLMRMLVTLVFVTMLMHVLVFFDTINGNVRMRAFYAALDALFETICDTGNANGIKLFFTGLNAARKLGQ